MSDDEQELDLTALERSIIERLDLLCAKSGDANDELADLAARIRASIETGDAEAQWALVDEIKAWAGEGKELHEEILNVLQLYYLYVHIKNGDGSDFVQLSEVDE